MTALDTDRPTDNRPPPRPTQPRPGRSTWSDLRRITRHLMRHPWPRTSDPKLTGGPLVDDYRFLRTDRVGRAALLVTWLGLAFMGAVLLEARDLPAGHYRRQFLGGAT